MAIRTLAPQRMQEVMPEEPISNQTWKELATSLNRLADTLERIERPLETIADSLTKTSEENLRRRLVETERKRKKW